MRKTGMVALMLAFVMSLCACNTVKGVGQDISAGGQAIDKAATKVQDKL